MTALKLSLLGYVLAGLAAAPSAAIAEQVVPPGNSAANQYTEAFPTAGGEKATGGRPEGREPSHVLGAHNAKKLEAAGPEGQEAAEVAAETSSPVQPEPETAGDRSSTPRSAHPGAAKATSGSGSSAPRSAHPGAAKATSGSDDTASDSSGLGEVIGQATGTSSAQGGLLMPLAILAAICGSLIYLWRHKRPA